MLDFNISRLVTKITTIIKNSEDKLKQMKNGDALISQDQAGKKFQSDVKKKVIENVT